MDADGRPTEDPRLAVAGEVVDRNAHGDLRRTRFFLAETDMPAWLPVGEAAFLAWTFAGVLLAWILIALLLL